MRQVAMAVVGLAFWMAMLAGAESYTVDNVHSSVHFKIQHFGAGFTWGRFNVMEGKFSYNTEDVTKGSIELTIKADSVDTNNAQRDTHLKGAFFNTQQFPTITFKSAKIEKGENGLLQVTGDLTLLGVTKSVTIAVKETGAMEDPMKSFRRGFETTFTIKRSEYGMKTMLDKNIGDEVTLMIAIEGVRQ